MPLPPGDHLCHQTGPGARAGLPWGALALEFGDVQNYRVVMGCSSGAGEAPCWALWCSGGYPPVWAGDYALVLLCSLLSRWLDRLSDGWNPSICSTVQVSGGLLNAVAFLAIMRNQMLSPKTITQDILSFRTSYSIIYFLDPPLSKKETAPCIQMSQQYFG